MVLRAAVGGRDWLVDCGFGAPGLREPIPFEEGPVAIQGHERFRFLRHGELGLLLQRSLGASGAWQDIYSISGEAALPIDFDVANHFTCTYPSSPFRSMLICGRVTPSGRALMRGATLHLEADGVARTRAIASGAEAVAALRADIGLSLDADLAAAIERRWSPPPG
jgi:N-hydroxyarylamine O-acetyltransferase